MSTSIGEMTGPAPNLVNLQPMKRITDLKAWGTAIDFFGFAHAQIYDGRGFLLEYGPGDGFRMHLKSIMDRNGRHPAANLPNWPFKQCPLQLGEFHPVIGTSMQFPAACFNWTKQRATSVRSSMLRWIGLLPKSFREVIMGPATRFD